MEMARRALRGRGGWLALIERGSASGLSVEAFCRQEGVSRSCFYRWRSLLASESGSVSATEQGVVRARIPAASPPVVSQGAFVDLGALGGSAGTSGRRTASRSGRGAGARLMFFPEGQVRVHLYGQPADMRKSFDGLSALANHAMGLDPLSGQLFVFINRRATQMKVLYFDRSGYCVWAKRLEAGRFVSDWSKVRSVEMDWTQLKLLLEGIEPGRRRKRYRHSAGL